MKKLEIQVIVFIILLTRSSERIFNPMRYAGVFLMERVGYFATRQSINLIKKYFSTIQDEKNR